MVTKLVAVESRELLLVPELFDACPHDAPRRSCKTSAANSGLQLASVFRNRLLRRKTREGPDAAVYNSKRDLPRFHGNLLDFQRNLLDFQLTRLTDKDARRDVVSVEDAAWIHEHFDVFNNLANPYANGTWQV